MARILYTFGFIVLMSLSFTAVYIWQNPELLSKLVTGPDTRPAAELVQAETTRSELPCTTDLNQAVRFEDARMEHVSSATGQASRFRELARGIVRVDLLFRHPETPDRYVRNYCTGAVVSDRHVLTARHCLDQGSLSKDLLVQAQILFDYADDQSAPVCGQLNSAPDGMLTSGGEGRTDDFLLMELAENEPSFTDNRILELGLDRDFTGKNLFVLHHPRGRPLHLSLANCYAPASNSGPVVPHKCSTYPASSGAPVFDLQTSKIVGVHIEGDLDIVEYQNKGAFLAVQSFSDVLTLIAPPQVELSDSTSNVVAVPAANPETAPGPERAASEEEISITGIEIQDAEIDFGEVAENADVVEIVEATPGMAPYILSIVDRLAEEKAGLGYGKSDYFTEDLIYGPGVIRGRNSPSTMCVAAISEILIRSIVAWSEDKSDDLAYSSLPASIWSDRNHIRAMGLWPWLFHWDMERVIPAYNRNFATGARDTFVLFGIGQSATFETALPGDVVYFNRTGGSGHAAIFLGYLKADYQETDEYDDEVVGFKYFSAQLSGTAGLDYRAAYFDGYCPANHAPGLRKDCTVIRSDDPRYLSFGRLNPPEKWSVQDRSIFIDRLFKGEDLAAIEADRYAGDRSLATLSLIGTLNLTYSEELTRGPAVEFSGETIENP